MILGEILRKSIRPLLANLTHASRHRPRLEEPGFASIRFESGDETPLTGWTYQAPGRECTSGTVILTHGFCENSASQVAEAKALSAAFGLLALAFDHRLHGLSGDGLPTFGSAEAFDIQAAMDYADRFSLPKPYIVQGTSLGAMGAQRAGIKDSRIAGLLLLGCPGWPWDAIGVEIGRLNPVLVPIGLLVNAYYGWDILGDGDIRAHHQPDGHQPLVCYVMGMEDHYGITNTRQAYAHWRGAGAENQFPTETPGTCKWFWALPGIAHPRSAGGQLRQWWGFERLQREFYERVLAEAKSKTAYRCPPAVIDSK